MNKLSQAYSLHEPAVLAKLGPLSQVLLFQAFSLLGKTYSLAIAKMNFTMTE
ncbi:MAG: hypothetical protein ACP5DZ_07430 [Bacteroidales bacterium]